MKVSRNWLQAFFEQPLPEAQALSDALSFHSFEVEGIEESGAAASASSSGEPKDAILDVKVLPNRGHDCLSHRGIAKELSAILKIPLKATGTRVALVPVADAVSVTIDNPELCSRYIAGYIRGVKVGPSPDWLRTYLESIGQRSINNIVDAANFVMLNIGQPLHAFDANKLASLNITVRAAKTGERILALGKEYELAERALVIADDTNPIAIAGVKGGKSAEVDASTTDLILEAANFDAVSVRRTAHMLKLRTDASDRFQQVLPADIAAYGMQDLVHLISEIAGGEVVGFVDAYPNVQDKKIVSVSLSLINGILGTELSAEDVEDVLHRLALPFTHKEGTWTVQVPLERLDLTIPEDLIEEVGRIVGFDKVPATSLSAAKRAPDINKNYYWSERVREFLATRGFSEIYSSIFAKEGTEMVLNKVESDTPYLRESLTSHMGEALNKNLQNANLLALQNICIFEIGTVFGKGTESVHLALGARGKDAPKPEDVFMEMCKELGASIPPYAKGADLIEIDIATLIDALPIPDSYDDLPLSAAVRFQPFSRYPFIVRDIATWVPEGGEAVGELLNIFAVHSEGLLRNVDLFDQFKKDGKVSYAFRLVFQSFDKTLTDKEANDMVSNMQKAIEAKGWQVR